ncbi:MAG: hypothetical protein ACFFKA_01290 [Candidatus Thorarchaeota archaeon]
MTRYYIIILKIINISIFVWIVFVFSSIFHFDEVLTTESGDLVFIAFLTSLRNIFSLIIFGAAYIIAMGLAFIGSLITFGTGLQPLIFRLIEQFFKGLISLWFTFPTPTGTAPAINQILDLMGIEFANFGENLRSERNNCSYVVFS